MSIKLYFAPRIALCATAPNKLFCCSTQHQLRAQQTIYAK
ncbi:hypothetical protein CPter91_4725 [Collimonas pratensis]|uniref:Uncharacterized protein n=1 Tax=Collimonas pratensis TaxID=279113 RepID=A0A127QAI3_9BURK|nr:hypothetical protein CPter91_4725 [Collimonas pratensis]